MRRCSLLLPLVLASTFAAAACSGDKGGNGGDGAAADDGDGPSTGGPGTDESDGAASFVLTSSAFASGNVIPVRHTCGGIDVSPPLAWTGSAATAYAVVLTDQTEGVVHSVLWDVPGDLTSLPEGIEKAPEPKVPAGAKQALAIDGETHGYFGPCPAVEHTYEFALHAVDEYPLSGVTLDSSREQLIEVLAQRSTAKATLLGTYEPSGW